MARIRPGAIRGLWDTGRCSRTRRRARPTSFGRSRVRTIAGVARIETAQGALGAAGFRRRPGRRRAPSRLVDAAPAPAARPARAGRRPRPRAGGPDRLHRRRPGICSTASWPTPVLPAPRHGPRRERRARPAPGLATPSWSTLLAGELPRTSATDLRAELLRRGRGRPAAAVPVATDLIGDGLRLAYRGALLRIAAPRPQRAGADRGGRRRRRRAVRPRRRHARGGAGHRPGEGRAEAAQDPAGGGRAGQDRGPGAQLRQRRRRALRRRARCATPTAQPLVRTRDRPSPWRPGWPRR